MASPIADKNHDNGQLSSAEASMKSSVGKVEEQTRSLSLDEPIEDYPEGGFAAWMTVAGAFFLQFTVGYINAFGVYQDFFTREFLTRFTASDISWIGSVTTFFVFSGGLISGRLFDSGYFYFLIVGGTLLVSFSLFMLSLAQPQQYYQSFLSLGVGYGIGTGALFVPSVAVISQWFRRRRALAMGIMASGSSLGSTLHPIMLNNLFSGRAGFANGVRASAGLMTGSLVLAAALMRTRFPARKQLPLWQLLLKVSKDKAYMCAVAAAFFNAQGTFFPIVYLQLDSNLHGLNPTFGFYSLAIMNVSAFFGRLFSGPLADTLGVLNATIFCSFMSTAVIFSMIAINTVASVAVIAVLVGFSIGAYISLLSPLLSSFATSDAEVGARIGIAFLFIGIGSLIGSPIVGALLTRAFIWWRAGVYAGVTTLVATVLLSISRFIVGGRTRGWRC